MSIYDGQCDRGSAINERCPNPATNFRGEYAWCDSDGQWEQLGDRTWADAAAAYDFKQKQIEETIKAAETGGDMLSRDGELYTPKEVRRMIANGYSVGALTIECNPLSWAASYEREADELISEAKEKRHEARRIRRYVAAREGAPETK